MCLEQNSLHLINTRCWYEITYSVTFNLVLTLSHHSFCNYIHDAEMENLLFKTELNRDFSGETNSHPLSHTAWKYAFNCSKTVLSRALDSRRLITFIDRVWYPLRREFLHVQMLIPNGEFTAYWSLRCLLSHATSTHDQPKVFMHYFYGFWNNGWIWSTRAFSIIGVCMTVIKIIRLYEAESK